MFSYKNEPNHLSCEKCFLQFDNKYVFDQHLALVHGEEIKLKKETSVYIDMSILFLIVGGCSATKRAAMKPSHVLSAPGSGRCRRRCARPWR